MSLAFVISLKFHSNRERSMEHSMASRRCRTAFTFEMSEARLGVEEFHSFSSLLRFLYFAVIFFAGSGEVGSNDHPCNKIGIKSSVSNQWFSNLKTFPLGIFVSILIIQGQ